MDVTTAAGDAPVAEGADTSGTPRWPPVAAVVLLVALSLWGLTTRPLWLDEAFTVGATGQLGRTLWDTAGTMGLYYVVVTAWTSIAGTSVAAVRLPSVAFMALSLPVVHAVARRCLRRDEAALAVLVAAASPALVRYAQEARSYALVVLLTTVSWLCLVRAVTDDDGRARRWWTAFALVSVAGTLAHGLYPLQLASQAASLLLLPDRRPLLRAAAPALAGTMACVVGLTALGADDIAAWVPPLSGDQLADLGQGLTGRPAIVAVGFLALALAGAVVLLRRPDGDPRVRWRTLVPVVWATGPPILLVLLSAFRPYAVDRYVLASVPALALLAAVAVRRLDRVILPRHWPAWARLVGPVAIVLAVLLAVGQVEVHREQGDDWRRAARTVAAGAEPGDAVVFTLFRAPFDAAWPTDDRVASPDVFPTPRPIGEVHRFDDFLGWNDVDRRLAPYDRVWVVHQASLPTDRAHLARVMELDTIRDRFEVVADHRFSGGVRVLLLSARP